MRKASKLKSVMLLGLLLAAMVISCKSKEGTADGTAADSTMVDSTTPPPPPPAQDIPSDSTATDSTETAK